MKKHHSLIWQLVGWLLPCAAAVLLAVWITAAWTMRTRMEYAIDQAAVSEVRHVSTKLDVVVHTIQDHMRHTADMITRKEPEYEDTCQLLLLMLNTLRQDDPTVYGGAVVPVPPNTVSPKSETYFYWKEGRLIRCTLGTPDYRYWEMPWYTIPRDTGKGHWTEPYFDAGAGNILMTTYSVPYYRIRNGKKIFAGVLTLDANIHVLARLLQKINFRKGGYAILLSQKGVCLGHPDPDMVGRCSIFSEARKHGIAELADIGKNMISGKEGKCASLRSTITGTPVRFYYAPVRSNGWSIGTGSPIRELLRPLRIMEFSMSILCISGLGLLTCGIVILCRKITRPLLRLSTAAKAIGSGNLQTPLPNYLVGDEIGILTDSFRQMQRELDRYVRELKSSTDSRLQIEGELQAAGAIQRSLLPPPPEGKDPRFQLAASLHPAKEVGGDLYDFAMRNDRYAVLTIGDVSGKGAPAAFFMAVMQTIQRSRMQDHPMPTEIADAVNAYLCKKNDAMMFVTWYCAIADLKTGDVHAVNAGHNAPRLVRADGTLEILAQVDGAPFGIMEIPYTESHFVMKPGDTLFCYTDGVTEAMDKDRQQYGEERMDACLRKQTLQASPEAWIRAVELDTAGFVGGAPQSDDITMLCFRYLGA